MTVTKHLAIKWNLLQRFSFYLHPTRPRLLLDSYQIKWIMKVLKDMQLLRVHGLLIGFDLRAQQIQIFDKTAVMCQNNSCYR